ncbi:MAG: hypothetical protein ACOC2N_01740 [Spirochaetota bacterium]
MKRIGIIALVLLVAVTIGATAQPFGIGGAFSIDSLGGLPSSAMLSVKVPQLPMLWGVGLQVNENDFNMAFTADWWLYQQNLVSFINLYVGPGLYLSLPNRIEFGGRVPIGINAYPIEVLELFFEVAPTLLFFSDTGIDIPSFGLQGAFGFRFWFNT